MIQKHCLAFFISLFTSSVFAYNAVPDTSVILNQVTIIDGQDPAKALVRSLIKVYAKMDRLKPSNLKRYSRQYSGDYKTIFEQLDFLYFSGKDCFQEVEAYKDYEEKRQESGASIQAGIDIDMSPGFDFNEDQPEGTFGKYPLTSFQNTSWTPLSRSVLSAYYAHPIPGLLVIGALQNYSFSIESEQFIDGRDIIVLNFEPKNDRIGWTGSASINSTEFKVESITATIEDIEIKQEFAKDNLWYVHSMLFSWSSGSNHYESKVVAVNVDIQRSVKNKMMVASVPEEQELRNDFWSTYRPKSEALDAWTARQDSLIRYLNSDVYLDSADAVYNAFHWYEPLVSGVGYRKRSKGTYFYFAPLIGQWNFVGIGGVRWMPSIVVGKRFSNYQSIKLSSNVNYGFLNNDLKGSLDLEYTYAPLHNGSVSFTMGDEYDQITQSIDLAGIFARSNFIRKTFVESYHRYEWINGFYTRLGLEYSQRESIEDLQFADWTNGLFGARNQPASFETYTVAQLGIEILIRPFQRYYLKGRQKIVLSSKWPDFKFTLKQGIPDIFGSDVSFTKYEMLIEDMLRFGKVGTSFYRLGSGGFLNDASTVRFIEHKWFRGGDYFLFTNPLYTYQTLDSTFASPSVYGTGSFMHHFDGWFLNKIPVLRKLKLGTAIGAAFLAVPNENVYHLESFVGLERKVKLWDTPTRFGIYYMLEPQSATPGFKFKLGVDIKDTFSDRWNF